jgi:hypothetical protein
MPTMKQRITITATGDLEQILAVEQRLHPDLSPSALVVMLIRRGAQADDQPRRALVEALAGGEHYPRDYRDALRDEWPS